MDVLRVIRGSPCQVLVCLLVLLAGCRSTLEPGRDIFLEERGVDPTQYELLGYERVRKIGFSLFGCIPFSIADRREGEVLLIKGVREKYPTAEGVCEVKFNVEEASFFDWIPIVEVGGKLVKKKSTAPPPNNPQQ